MRKKLYGFVVISVFLILALTGCKPKMQGIVGTWYCDQNDASVLMLKKGRYLYGRYLVDKR